jgi:hypothetical protein
MAAKMVSACSFPDHQHAQSAITWAKQRAGVSCNGYFLRTWPHLAALNLRARIVLTRSCVIVVFDQAV